MKTYSNDNESLFCCKTLGMFDDVKFHFRSCKLIIESQNAKIIYLKQSCLKHFQYALKNHSTWDHKIF